MMQAQTGRLVGAATRIVIKGSQSSADVAGRCKKERTYSDHHAGQRTGQSGDIRADEASAIKTAVPPAMIRSGLSIGSSYITHRLR